MSLPVHPAFRLSNVAQLPDRYKRLAMLAMQGNPDDIDALRSAARDLKDSVVHRILPVVHHFLQDDSSSLQDLVGRDGFPALTKRVEQLLATFNLIRHVALSSNYDSLADILRVLLPRIWFWIEFLEALHAQVDFIPLPHFYDNITVMFVAVMSAMGQEEVFALPGLRCMFGRAWMAIVRDRENDLPDRALPALSLSIRYFTYDVGFEGSTALEELCRALRGEEGLAMLIIDHLKLLFSTRLVRDPETTFDDFFLFIEKASSCCRRLSEQLQRFRLAQWLIGFAAALPSSEPSTETIFNRLVDSLLDTLSTITPHLPACIAGCLNKRFLAVLPVIAAETEDQYSALIECLSAATVFRPVLEALERLLPTMEDVELDDNTCAHLWDGFLQLARERIVLLEKSDLGKLRACHNAKCSKVGPKVEFKRCGGCMVAHYCSKTCQREDYRASGHRTRCAELRASYMHDQECLSTGDLAFLRVVLNHEFAVRKEEIGVKLVEFWRTVPDQSLAASVNFDFSHGECEVTVHPLDQDFPGTADALERLRAAAREFDGAKHAILVFLIRIRDCSVRRRLSSSDTVFVDGLWDIAQGLRKTEDAVGSETVEDVRALIKRCDREGIVHTF
ncbi:MYND-type domain-containing protein [Mycena kentingensis (nom. inval.)]|nr:MYND-type domain-containing protein [Mycena kentingensis (nom. inval.)]